MRIRAAAQSKTGRRLSIRFSASLLFALALACGGAGRGLAQSAGPPDARPLVFLGNESLPPMAWREGGKQKGIVVDLVSRLAVVMGRKIVIRLMNWSEAQRIVDQGGADALIQINATEERLRVLDFSGPLLDSRFVIFVQRQRLGISNVEGLEGLKVGVEQRGFPELALRSDPRVGLQTIPTILDGFRMLRRGQIDAVVVDEWVGQYTLATNNINDIYAIGQPVAVSQSAIAVRKGDTELLQAINAGLSMMRADGTYQAILEQWRPQSIVYQTRSQLQNRLRTYVMIVAILLFVFFAAMAVVQSRRLAAERGYREEITRKSKQLAEEELILREVHHRIKNNMGTVIGLLSLQGQNSPDEGVRTALEDAANRIMSMMVLYDRLYRTSSYEALSLREYISPLLSEVMANFPESDTVSLVEKIDDIVLEPTTIHNIGMMVNELITNTMKYAFRGIENPEIRVAASARENRVRLSIADNGIGLPTSVEPEQSSGFGLTLVRELTKQLNGSMKILRQGGTEVVIEFEKPPPS